MAEDSIRGCANSSSRTRHPPATNQASQTSNQTWATFLRNHASQIWACDFLQAYDIFFRTTFVFVIIELGSRRIVRFCVTRNPTDQWTAQQLRAATALGLSETKDRVS